MATQREISERAGQNTMGFKNGKRTIIINIVKRDKEIKVQLYRSNMSTKRK
jgi:hypothetical protein